MDLSVLVDEIQKPEYAGMDEQTLLAALNAKKVKTRKLVSTVEILRTAIEEGYYANIRLAADDTSLPLEARAAAISIRAWVEDPSGKIENADLDRPSVKFLLSRLGTAGFCKQHNIDTLDALADNEVLWRDHVGLGEIGIGYLTNAMRVIRNDPTLELIKDPPVEVVDEGVPDEVVITIDTQPVLDTPTKSTSNEKSEVTDA